MRTFKTLKIYLIYCWFIFSYLILFNFVSGINTHEININIMARNTPYNFGEQLFLYAQVPYRFRIRRKSNKVVEWTLWRFVSPASHAKFKLHCLRRFRRDHCWLSYTTTTVYVLLVFSYLPQIQRIRPLPCF